MSSTATIPTVEVEDHHYLTAEGSKPRATWRTLIILLLLALPLRVYWMAQKTPVITVEGSEYVRMADSLIHGKGLIGNFEGPETMYTPLFSVLTAGMSMLTGKSELAAHLVSLLFGTALIIPVFFIANKMYGPRVAVIAGLLVGFHPVLVKLAASIYNENVYLPLLMGGMYFTMEAFERPGIKNRVFAGLCFGFAYLTRPEAFAYPILLAGALWLQTIVRSEKRVRAHLAAFLPLAIFLLLAVPYMAYLYRHTGHVRLEGKWNINYTIANRIRSGMEYNEAAYGLGQDLQPTGPLLDPFRFAAYTPYKSSLTDKLTTLFGMAKRNTQTVYSYLFYDRVISSPVIIGLIALAWFARAWNRRRLEQELIVFAMAGTLVFLILTSSNPEFRYLLGLIALSMLWIARGIDEIRAWTVESASLLRLAPSWLLRSSIGYCVQIACFVLILGIAERGARSLFLFNCEQQNFSSLKQAGVWLGDHGAAGKRIACASTVITYYSKATIIGLPDASPNQALSYIGSEHIDFVVLDSWSARDRPEEREWLRNGMPDSRATLVYQIGSNDAAQVEVYRWDAQKLSTPSHSQDKGSERDTHMLPS